MKRMTKKQKQIISYADPTYDSFASTKEIKEAWKLSRGKYWIYPDIGNDGKPDFEEYIAVSPSGKRAYFEYSWYNPCAKQIENKLQKLMRKCARLHAVGNLEKSRRLLHALNEWYQNKMEWTIGWRKSLAAIKKIEKLFK